MGDVRCFRPEIQDDSEHVVAFAAAVRSDWGGVIRDERYRDDRDLGSR